MRCAIEERAHALVLDVDVLYDCKVSDQTTHAAIDNTYERSETHRS